jgi:hypothetical protein
MLKPGKHPTLPPSYRPISLPDTFGKIFEKIVLTSGLREVNECGLLRVEQFGFRPKHSTTLQLACLIKWVNRNFDEIRLNGPVFLGVAKAFDTVWVKGLLYKLTVLKFPSHLMKTISSHLDCRKFQTSFQTATSTCVMRAGVARGVLVSPLLFSLYVNDIPTPPHNVELAQYVVNTAVIHTSRDPSLLVGYLEAYLGRLMLWLRDWRIGFIILKSTAVLFARPRDASENLGQFSFSESQQSASKQLTILG